MSINENIKALKSSTLFAAIDKDELEHIAKHIVRKTFDDKQLLINQSDDAEAAYLILSGSVKVFRIAENGNEITLSILGPGEIVGEMSLIESEDRSASVAAIQKTEVLIITKGAFTHFIKSSPDAAIKLIQTMAKRVRVSDKHVEEILTKNIRDRILGSLKILTSYFPNGEIVLSHEDLADIIGATRPRVTEVLDELVKDKKISLSHRKITLI